MYFIAFWNYGFIEEADALISLPINLIILIYFIVKITKYAASFGRFKN